MPESLESTAEKKEIMLTCRVDSYRSGWTIVEFLAHRFKYHTAEGWEKRVSDKWVRVGGQTIAPGHVVGHRDEITYTIWHAEPEVDFSYDVLHEDDDILAVSKSGDIPVHACGVFITNTLIARLKEDFGPTLNLCHRLDRETSGVVVLSKNKETNREIAGMFARGEVEKRYLAVVFGEVKEDEFTIDAPIGKIDIRYQYPVEYEYGKENNLATYLPKRAVDFENGKQAVTDCRVLSRKNGFTTLRIFPRHGRTNQIRVHLAHIGHPLVGDKIYALEGELRDELLSEGLTDRVNEALVMPRHALHCESLTFVHPMTNEPLELHAPSPASYQQFLTIDR